MFLILKHFLQPIVEVFSLLAIATSYIGFVLGLSDFLADCKWFISHFSILISHVYDLYAFLWCKLLLCGLVYMAYWRKWGTIYLDYCLIYCVILRWAFLVSRHEWTTFLDYCLISYVILIYCVIGFLVSRLECFFFFLMKPPF